MGNSLTIISSKQKEKLYKDLEGKWLIELDGRKMNNWDDFYYQIMPKSLVIGISRFCERKTLEMRKKLLRLFIPVFSCLKFYLYYLIC